MTESSTVTVPQPPVKNTKFCSECGAEINSKAEICPKCGVRAVAQAMPPSGKNKTTAAILSILIPGLGQFYCGRAARGVVVFFVAALISIISAGILAIPIWIVGAWDAYKVAQGQEIKIGGL